MKKWILALTCLLLFHPLFAQEKKVIHSVFLVGDAGEPSTNGKDAVLQTLQKHLQKAGTNATLAFLGDNIYPVGLVGEDAPPSERDTAIARLKAQLDLIKQHKGRSFIIPGNHDWQQGGRNGWEYIKNQEQFVASYLQKDDVFYPKGGCPTPQEIHLNAQLTLVLLDTQWFLHPWEKPAEGSDCEVKDLAGMLTAIDDILYRNTDKKVIVLAHHPIYSYGNHGGYFTWKDHLLPFHELGVYIPLPVIGSIYPLYRKLIGNIQDIAHPVNKEMTNGLNNIIKQYPNVMYVNGHEHNLQWIVKDSINYITSGAGSKNTPIKKGKNALFTAMQKGFFVINLLDDATLEGHFISASDEVLFTQNIHFKHDNPSINTAISASTTHIPNARFKANAFQRWLLGSNYRDIWTRPITVPTLDLKDLKIVQRGGGQQTLSLRYESPTRGYFVTRSVEKYPESAIPASIRSKFTVDIVGDQISASHPFAALAIPPLADAAQVLHTNPRLVTIPNDALLGRYQRLFAGQLALFEERPDEGFAGAKKIYSTTKLFEKLADDNHHKVDEKATLRARLLDMLIGDWDRHEDQWRWAAFEQGKETFFRPIPRDRDQAFFVNQGVLPRIIARKWILPKIQGFDLKIRDINTFNYNARYVDRAFLTQLSANDWQQTAQALQQSISDSLIDSAVSRLPQPDPHIPEIAHKLKQRRNDLVAYALGYHRFLSKEIDIVASNKDEVITVHRLDDGTTAVKLYDQNKKNEQGKLLYSRLFDPRITKEIRIWGLDGEDRFVVSGQAHQGIKLRLIGGKGKDIFVDSSWVAKGSRKTLIYDKKAHTTIMGGSETLDKTSEKDKQINELNRSAFVYNTLAPLASFAYNPDDGLFVGGGVQITNQGFRKSPYASKHSLSGNYAFATQAFNLYYTGSWIDVLGKTDLELKVNLQQEGMTDNFFGMSNESVFLKEKGISYYRTKLSNYENSLLLKNHFNKVTLYYGVVYSGYDVKENPTRFINEYAPIGSPLYQERDFLGVRLGTTIDTRNHPVLPTMGMRWDINATYQHGILSSYQDEYFNLKTDLAFHYTFKLPAVVSLATRVGAGFNMGDYAFYQANTLGGLSNLRGFRRSRFSGQNAFYNNTEVRLKLLTFKSYLFPASLGVLAFHDVGRVWNPHEQSNKWHHGYGAGVWLAPFQMAVLTGTFALSEEEQLFTIKMGFFF